MGSNSPSCYALRVHAAAVWPQHPGTWGPSEPSAVQASKSRSNALDKIYGPLSKALVCQGWKNNVAKDPENRGLLVGFQVDAPSRRKDPERGATAGQIVSVLFVSTIMATKVSFQDGPCGVSGPKTRRRVPLVFRPSRHSASIRGLAQLGRPAHPNPALS